MANPRQANVEAALAAFYAERAPKLARRLRILGGVVGTHRYQRRKRNAQRRNAGTWRFRP